MQVEQLSVQGRGLTWMKERKRKGREKKGRDGKVKKRRKRK